MAPSNIVMGGRGWVPARGMGRGRAGRRLVVGVAALTAMTFAPIPAARAGGTVFGVHGSNHAWGEQVVTKANVANHVRNRGSVSDGPWFAYLNDNYATTRRIDEGTILGRVRFHMLSRDLAKARLTFTVPRVPPGQYTIQVCNVPCTMELGDFVATYFTIASTAGEVQLLERIDDLQTKFDRMHGGMRRQVVRQVRALGARLRAHIVRVTNAANASDDDRPAPLPRDRGLPWVPITAAGAAALVASYALGRRGRPKSRAAGLGLGARPAERPPA